MDHEISPSVLRSEILGSFKGVRRLVLVFVVVVVVFGLVGLVYGAENIGSHTVDVLSFTSPPLWKTTQKAGSGPMTMSQFTLSPYDDDLCEITVYNSRQSSGDLATDFFSEWKAIIGSAFPDAGYVSDEGASIAGTVQSVPISGLNKWVELVTYSAGAKMASIVAVAPAPLQTNCALQIGYFFKSVIVNSAASGTPRVDAGQQAQEGQQEQAQAAAILFGAPDWVDEWNKQVRMSDLSGEWKNTSTVPGDESTVYTETYVFKEDGTFTSLFQARGAKTVNEEHQGTYALSPRPVIKYVTGAAHTYNILDFEQLPDGSSTMNIVDSVYPIDGLNDVVYREKLIRAAPKAIPRPN